MQIDVFTLFPDWFDWFRDQRHMKNLFDAGHSLETVDMRATTPIANNRVDDTPYGGGAGMVIRVDVVEAALRGRYVREPEVIVNIKSSVSQVVTVDGQVVEPGLYPVTNQMTLMRAIASAKGLSEFARQEDVVILRTVEGRKMAGLYSIAAIRRGAYDDPPIYANDVIVVGDSPQRRLFRDLVALSPLLASPLIAILQ